MQADDRARRDALPRQIVRKRVAPVLENATESALACLLTMVQGNVLALTLGHWLLASQTGAISGVLAASALWLTGRGTRWKIAGVVTLATGVVDYFSHPTHFGSAATESIVTGLVAGALSVVVSMVSDRLRGPREAVVTDLDEASLRGTSMKEGA